MARIIAIVNGKGGSGKTTTATNLGAYLAKLGKRILLCDIDPQANATISFGFFPKKNPLNLYHALLGGVPIKEIIKKTSLFNLDLVPSGSDLAGANIELLESEEKEESLKKILEDIGLYDFILLDPPPSLGILTLNTLVAADEVLVPIQCEFFALKSIEELLGVLNLLEENWQKNFKNLLGLLTMYDKRNLLSHQIVKETREKFPGRVLETIIPRTVRLAEAPRFGKTIFQYAPESKAARAYERLAEEIIKIMPNEK